MPPRRGSARILALLLFPWLLAWGSRAAGALPNPRDITPGPGSPAAATMTVGNTPVLRLHCPFSHGGLDRAFWDVAVNWDLRGAAGISLDLLCTDTGPVSQFNVYIRANGVWHAATVAPKQAGQWDTIRVLKTATSPEGTSRGWSTVDAVRVAAWRGSDRNTDLYLARLERLDPNVPVAVLRGSATVDSKDRGVAQRYARNVQEALASAGVLAAGVEDADVSAAALAPYRLVFLAYHPSLPAAATKALTDFVAAGGKVVGFYNQPEALGRALGIRTGAYMRSAQLPEGVAGIAFAPSGIAGLPPWLRQDSANFLDVIPENQGARPVGWWAGRDAARTPHCALAVSSRGAWCGHVYQARDTEQGPRLMLALAGHFVGGVWEQAARHALQTVVEGIAAPGSSFAATAAAVRERGRGAALQALAAAEAQHAAAQQRYRAGDHPGAVEAVAACRARLAEAILSLQTAPAAEMRGVWCHRGYGIDGWSWEQSAQVLSASGINALFVNVANGAAADYPSAVLRPSYVLEKRGDQLRACLDACRSRGVQVHAWKICFRLPDNADAAMRSGFERDGLLQRTFEGKTQAWLCPSHAANRTREAKAAAELVARYPDLAGVHLDFIRFPGSDSCFCETCRRGLEQAQGRKVASWPADVRRDAAWAEAWRQYRRQVISRTVRETAAAVRRERPSARVSAAVFSNWASARDGVGQDWAAWAKDGDVDFLCPMSYHEQAQSLQSDVQRQRAWVQQTRAAAYPGIGVSTGKLDALETLRQINVARAAGTGGFVLFEFGRREATEVLPALAPALGGQAPR